MPTVPPEPDGPSSAVMELAGTSRLTSLAARKGRPLRVVYSFVMFRTCDSRMTASLACMQTGTESPPAQWSHA